ncbi:Mbov_0400 family ICE element protein, partial [Mycoplasmopsis agalactiae]|uniref:Mbov_0400 family ICE element protein n=1 Tax=Mycoplasmopsis agalactiae TaxID=2110 RepID=UPI001F3B1C49
ISNMSKLLIGRVYKQRNKENRLPIAKNRNGDEIDAHGANRPFLIFYSDDKVYYLSAKSITDKNRELTAQDKGNLVLQNDLYGNDKEIAINCSVINVMDRNLFESLFEKDNELNNYLTSPSIYNSVMEKLYENLDDIQYFEVDSFVSDRTIWKTRDIGLLNKDTCEKIINTY